MLISTEIGSIANYVGEEKAIEYVAKAGFDAYDLSMFRMVNLDWKTQIATKSDNPLAQDNYREYALKLKKIADDNGIVCNQSHAPFPSNYEGMEEFLIRALEITSIVGGKICVIHPCNNDDYKKNAKLFRRLLPYAKKFGVKIATENMWCWDEKENHATTAACSHHDDFVRHIDEVNDEYLVACLDLGHAEMEGLNTSAPISIKALGPRLQALHIHDNDRHHDSHQIPFSMDIDFEAIIKALKEINYQGDLTLEADAYIRSKNGENIFDCVCNMKKAAEKLLEMYNEK